MDVDTVTESTHLLDDLVIEDDRQGYRGKRRVPRTDGSPRPQPSPVDDPGPANGEVPGCQGSGTLSLWKRLVGRARAFLGLDHSPEPLPKQGAFTVQQAIEHIGFGKFQIKLFLICGLFQVTDALEMLLLAVLSPALRCAWNLPDWKVAFTTTVVFIGSVVGSNIWGMCGDKFGRVPVLKISVFWIGFYGILSAASPFYSIFVLLRANVGFGYGGAALGFTLFTEYLPIRYRAKMMILYYSTWAFGSLSEVVVSYMILPTLGWRSLVVISSAPMLASAVVVWFLPESARYLLAASRNPEALAVLKDAAKSNGTSLPEGHLVSETKLPQGRYRDLFRPGYIHVTLQIWLLWFGAACSYYGIILLQTQILERGGVCERNEINKDEFICPCREFNWDQYSRMMIATLGEFVAIPINFLCIDFLGRKKTIAMNFSCACFFFLMLQFCMSPSHMTLMIFGARTFSSGVLNVMYTYTTEVFPTVVRGLAVGTSASIARTGAMSTPLIAQVLMDRSPITAVWLYGGLCAVCAVNALFLPVETSGKGLTQTKIND